MSSNNLGDSQTTRSDVDVSIAAESSLNEANVNDTDKMVLAKLQKLTAGIVRASNALPKVGDGYELYASYPDFAKFMEQQRLRLILAMRKLLANIGCRLKISALTLEDMEKLIFANDLLVERVGISFEEHQRLLTQEFIVKTRVSTGAEPVPGSVDGTQSMVVKDGGRYATMFGKAVDSVRLSTGGNDSLLLVNDSFDSSGIAIKPQLAFRDSIVNADLTFVPKLIVKHNALKVRRTTNMRLASDDVGNDGMDENRNSHSTTTNVLVDEREWLNESAFGEHPYADELRQFTAAPQHLTAPKELAKPTALEDTPFVLVDNEEKLLRLVDDLNTTDVFGVDVEHHNHRSYLGLTCLLQISTRTTDYVIDPFPIWRSMHLLNEPFTNPSIVKVFHAGYHDVIWLQRDFGIYVVNLFDTSVAMRHFGANRLSLKNMLSQLCGVTINKHLQTSDWRIRPLSDAHLQYARSDAHYLPYCYDRLRADFAQREPNAKKATAAIRKVFEEGVKIAEKLFEQPRFDEDGYQELLNAHRPLSNNRQVHALKQLWRWRDATAREYDESLHYVLPAHMMLTIAEVLPREMNGILACCAPVPPLVKHDIATLFKFISAARDLPLKKYEHTSVADMGESSAAADGGDASVEANRITRLKAKLDYHIDCTNFDADEEIASADRRVDQLIGGVGTKRVEEKENIDAPMFLAIDSKRGGTMVSQFKGRKRNGNDSNYVFVDDQRDEVKSQKNIVTRVRRVRHRIEQWQLPYLCYLATKRHLGETAAAESSDGPTPAKRGCTTATVKTEDVEEQE